MKVKIVIIIRINKRRFLYKNSVNKGEERKK